MAQWKIYFELGAEPGKLPWVLAYKADYDKWREQERFVSLEDAVKNAAYYGDYGHNGLGLMLTEDN